MRSGDPEWTSCVAALALVPEVLDAFRTPARLASIIQVCPVDRIGFAGTA